MTVGDRPAVVNELLSLRRAVVAVDRVQLLSISESVPRELAEGGRVVAAVAGSDVHRPGPVAVGGEGFEDVTLPIGDLRGTRGSGGTW